MLFFTIIGVGAVLFGGLWLLGQWESRQPESRRSSVNEWIGRTGLVMMFAGIAGTILPAIF